MFESDKPYCFKWREISPRQLSMRQHFVTLQEECITKRRTGPGNGTKNGTENGMEMERKTEWKH